MKKKAIVRWVPVMAICFTLSALQPLKAQMRRFHYYPKANVYYDVANKTYIYNAQGNWVSDSSLPQGKSLEGSQRVVMYSMKPEIWLMNGEHVERYKNHPPVKAKRGKLFSLLR